MLGSLVVALLAPLALAADDSHSLAVSFRLEGNGDETGFHAVLTLTNTGTRTLSGSWSLYFNSRRSMQVRDSSAHIRVEHINGDLYRLVARAQQPPLEPGKALALPLEGRHWMLKHGEAPAGFYLIAGSPEPTPVVDGHVEPFENKLIRRGSNDQVPTPDAASRYEANKTLSLLPEDQVALITPTPHRMEIGKGTYTLTTNTAIDAAPALAAEAAWLSSFLKPLVPSRKSGGEIRLKQGPVTIDGEASTTEAYEMIIDSNGITITGSDSSGVFYGLQSLRALIDPGALKNKELSLPFIRIKDKPRFAYRGMHLDVSRNFQSLSSVKRLLDVMAFYKLNKFHFHLTDDEGWRLEIPDLPELTLVGGRRSHDLQERTSLIPAYGSGPDGTNPAGSGFYTRAQYIELLEYAAQRHIEVIPEIDMPGHARAAIVAMKERSRRLMEVGKEKEASEFRLHNPSDQNSYMSVQNWKDNVVCVGQESTYRFVTKVMDEIKAMYREAGLTARSIHIGGDEVPHGVWIQCPACKAVAEGPAREVGLSQYFLSRVTRILADRGISTSGWEEIAAKKVPSGRGHKLVPNPDMVHAGLIPYVWNSVTGWGAEDLAYQLANTGYSVVLCNVTNLYFDLAYDKDPNEPGLYWGGFVDTRKAWEFVPLDLFFSSNRDLLGRPVSPEHWNGRTRLTKPQNIQGIQGQLWSETLISPDRLDYMAFPKLLGLAERAWAKEPQWSRQQDRIAMEQAWNRFANALGQRELPRLDQFPSRPGYRIPPPGARMQDGILYANTAFPGLTLRYTTDGSEPDMKATVYTKPIALSGTVKVKAFDTRGRSSRSSVAR